MLGLKQLNIQTCLSNLFHFVSSILIGDKSLQNWSVVITCFKIGETHYESDIEISQFDGSIHVKIYVITKSDKY